MSMLLAILCFCADEPAADDPIQRKLQRAGTVCDSEVKAQRQKIAAWLTKNEAAARKRGDLKKVEQIQRELKELKDEGRTPPATPQTMRRSHTVALNALASVYKESIQRYLTRKNDAKAKELTQSLAELRATDVDFNGEWVVTHSTGWSGRRVIYGSGVSDGAEPPYARWRLEKTAFIVEWNGGGFEKMTVNPDDPNRLLGARGDGITVSWNRVKPQRR